jgi:hypothetical protein
MASAPREFGGDGRSTKEEDMEDIRDYEKDEKKEKKTVPLPTLLGVALVGAVSSALLYYFFVQLDEEKKQNIKDWVVSQGKQVVAQMTHKEIE